MLWYDSVDAGSVYGNILGAQVLLFAVFGILTAAAVVATTVVLIRHRPRFRPDPARHKWRARYLRVERRFRPWLIGVLALYLGVRRRAGRASHRWQIYEMWRHAQSFHQTDPQFHRDISYFVFVLPFHRAVVTYLSSIVVTCLVITLVAGYLYGAIRIRGRGRKLTPALKAQVSVLLGLYLLIKAASYWLSRYSLTTSSRGPVTGLVLHRRARRAPRPHRPDRDRDPPGRAADRQRVARAAALDRGRCRRHAGRRPRASAPSCRRCSTGSASSRAPRRVDRVSIERNQAATLKAFGLDKDITTEEYGASGSAPTTTSVARAVRTAQIRLLDPNKLTPTFNNKQEIAAFYQFKSPLDIGHYPLGARDQDVAIAARELNLSGISRNSWSNKHLIYTHGYGVVAAPTDRMGETPTFINGDLPPVNQIPVKVPQIYFGQHSPSYSIVGQPAGSTEKVEFDHPSTNGGSNGVHNTYQGKGGVPIGSRLTRLLYAVQLARPEHLLLQRDQLRLPAADGPRPARPRRARSRRG